MNRNLVVILGMHRSGTSLLSAGLAASGLNLGSELMGANKFNSKGHWEDNDIVAFNNRILKEFRLQWDSIEFVTEEMLMSESCLVLIEQGKQLLLKKLDDNSDSFAFKDPRTIRLLPFWIMVFDSLKLTPKYVFITRNPLDVCKSLERREAKASSLSQLIWLQHNIGQLGSLKQISNNLKVVDFYDFCKKPRETLEQLAIFLSLQAPEQSLIKFAEHFYDESLVNQQTDPYQLSESKLIFGFTADVYRLLRCNSFVETPSFELLNNAYSNWKVLAPYLFEFSQVQEFEKESDKLNVQKSSSHSQSDFEGIISNQLDILKNNIEAQMSGLTSSIKHIFLSEDDNVLITKLINDTETQNILIREQLDELKRCNNNYLECISLLSVLVSISEKKLTSLRATEELNEKLLIKYERKVCHMKKVINNKENELNLLRSSKSWWLTSPFRWLFSYFTRNKM